ncbi:MAG: radical SAM protein [Candidatus Omnitrophica bacterium]|nr:radical SAM protein [Candidatus Omnitrophota bacterium]
MRVLLANPSVKQNIGSKYERYYIRSGSRWPHSGVKIKGQLPHYLPFPFFLGYAAALLKSKNYETYVLDSVAEDLDETNFLEKVQAINPDLVFYEISALTAEYDFSLAYRLKNIIPGLKIALGGPYATVYGYQMIKERSCFDFAIKGEYEFPLLSIVDYLLGNKELAPGVIYKSSGSIIDSGSPCLIKNLDDLPYPARELFPSNENTDLSIYWDGFCQNYPAHQVQASRGCLYRCYFCLWNQVIYNNGNYRKHSASRVLEEIEMIQNRYGSKEIYFDDDDFTVDKDYVYSICSEITKNGLDIKWSCMADSINTDEDLIKTMAKSGCIGIKFGVESASAKILKNIGKPVSLERVKKLTSLCSKYGIKTHAAFTLGLLEEEPKDIRLTGDFIKNLDVDSVQVSIAMPYPGTAFYQALQPDADSAGPISDIYNNKNPKRRALLKIRRKILSAWLIRRWLNPLKMFKSAALLSRSVKGIGVRVFFAKIYGLYIDEAKNR